ADAALGGKTGFDLYDLKNLVGSFRPADLVYMPTDALVSLPRREWLSGFAEVIKTAVIGDEVLLDLIESNIDAFSVGPANPQAAQALPELVSRCVAVKGRIVEADPTETGSDRALLNLGHTFGHALESCVGLGTLTHGEAVAWGMARACALGVALGITPAIRADRIVRLLAAYGYQTSAVHPAAPSVESLISAMGNDKKKKAGTLRFIVPGKTGATLIKMENSSVLQQALGGIS
ncbi:MAG: 3-dehydroquinate synthase family protein, partial [Treponemataceae bacterium]